MAMNELKVAADQLRQTATQWQGLSTGFGTTAPSPGQPFQPTTAAITAIDAAIGVGAAVCAVRIQATAASVAAAATGYTSQDASGRSELAGVSPPVVMV
ncbi:hypothetical protein [Mycobacterium szulgai]|uniref:PE domain-containing protein n=1 Tax=Mycobacterium szulgai TaxID=1787 RepID=A0A1X2DKT9_MYCSZ|nr:hypothetical protein [Mycobacterium szulgai]MCV7076976.1 hypothetical protein [Mycobacterium szulgai]ORW88802.1 hypothetical protein AWC27_13975 [Mycobacterium szulgai]